MVNGGGEIFLGYHAKLTTNMKQFLCKIYVIFDLKNENELSLVYTMTIELYQLNKWIADFTDYYFISTHTQEVNYMIIVNHH